MTYRTESDWHPFRGWTIKADSESEARLALCALIGAAYEFTSATLGGGKWEATYKESLTVGATAEESSVDHLRDAAKMMQETQP